MAAAYAALVSLLNTMHQIQTHHLLSTSFNNYPNESLRENIDFLLHFVENYSDADSCREAEDLVRRIAVVAHEAEDIIEVHAADLIRAPASTQQSESFLPILQRVIGDMNSVKEQIIKIKEDSTGNHHHLLLLLPPASSSSAPPPTPMVDNSSESEDLEALDTDEIMQVQPADQGLLPDTQNTKEDMGPIKKKAKHETGSINHHRSSSSSSTKTTKMVGFDGYLDQLLDQLTGQPSSRKILPIVGMGGIEIGKKIVVKCKGFPLAIVVVGGFLKTSTGTLEYWEKVAKDKSLVLHSGQANNASDILWLSYKHLPIWLKPCFLYFGLFPEDDSIKVSKLIKLWVAQGFIKSNSDQSLEEIAENYVNELVDRNLVLVGSLRLNKKFKTCLVHDLVRDLCLRIAEKENFYCVQRDIDGKRHFIVDERTARFYHIESHTLSLVHPLILDGQRAVPSNSRLLRVWFPDGKSPYSHFQEVSLRLLIFESTHGLRIPPSVSLLWSLQTLIVTGRSMISAKIIVPRVIWEMPQLRHIDIFESFHLPDPPPSDDVFVLHNLQTLATVKSTINLSKEVCKRIPNIKKLGIRIDMEYEKARNCIHGVGFFNKLESLRCYCYRYVGYSFQNLNLPSSLKKLTLKDSRLEWRDMRMIGSLPHLQILKLLDNAVIGAEWNCVEGEFVCLKHLEFRRCRELTSWIADRSHFPVLETLAFYSLSKLEEIPSDIGNVPTLEKISLFSCSYSAALSAVRILEEQESLGYLGLQVRTMFYHKSEALKLREEIEELAITSPNLLIYGAR